MLPAGLDVLPRRAATSVTSNGGAVNGSREMSDPEEHRAARAGPRHAVEDGRPAHLYPRVMLSSRSGGEVVHGVSLNTPTSWYLDRTIDEVSFNDALSVRRDVAAEVRFEAKLARIAACHESAQPALGDSLLPDLSPVLRASFVARVPPLRSELSMQTVQSFGSGTGGLWLPVLALPAGAIAEPREIRVNSQSRAWPAREFCEGLTQAAVCCALRDLFSSSPLPNKRPRIDIICRLASTLVVAPRPDVRVVLHNLIKELSEPLAEAATSQITTSLSPELADQWGRALKRVQRWTMVLTAHSPVWVNVSKDDALHGAIVEFSRTERLPRTSVLVELREAWSRNAGPEPIQVNLLASRCAYPGQPVSERAASDVTVSVRIEPPRRYRGRAIPETIRLIGGRALRSAGVVPSEVTVSITPWLGRTFHLCVRDPKGMATASVLPTRSLRTSTDERIERDHESDDIARLVGGEQPEKRKVKDFKVKLAFHADIAHAYMSDTDSEIAERANDRLGARTLVEERPTDMMVTLWPAFPQKLFYAAVAAGASLALIIVIWALYSGGKLTFSGQDTLSNAGIVGAATTAVAGFVVQLFTNASAHAFAARNHRLMRAATIAAVPASFASAFLLLLASAAKNGGAREVFGVTPDLALAVVAGAAYVGLFAVVAGAVAGLSVQLWVNSLMQRTEAFGSARPVSVRAVGIVGLLGTTVAGLLGIVFSVHFKVVYGNVALALIWLEVVVMTLVALGAVLRTRGPMRAGDAGDSNEVALSHTFVAFAAILQIVAGVLLFSTTLTAGPDPSGVPFYAATSAGVVLSGLALAAMLSVESDVEEPE